MNVRQHLIFGLDELCLVGTVKEGCSHYKKEKNTADESSSNTEDLYFRCVFASLPLARLQTLTDHLQISNVTCENANQETHVLNFVLGICFALSAH